MKKSSKFFILAILVATFVSLFPLLQPNFYKSHDGDAHVARFAAYFQAFQDGQIIPRCAGNLNFGYGTPVFIFYYPLPGYLSSALHALGFSFEITFKILIMAVFLAAPLTFYLWAKQLFKKEIAFIGALMYAFAPYHFLNLYVRGDIAELFAFVFIPLVLYCLEKIFALKQQTATKYILLGGIFYALLILSHNGISLMFSPVFVFYACIRSMNKKTFFSVGSLLVIGLMLAAFFWIPALYESRYTNIHLFIADMFKNHFPMPIELLYSNWGFGTAVRKEGGLSPQIGILYVALVVVGIIFAIKEKQQRKVLLSWIAVFFMAVFITLPFSSFLWQNIPILRLYEFPWRFTALSSFAAIVVACYVFSRIKNQLFLAVFLLLLFITSIPFIKVQNYVSYPDSYYQNHTGTTYSHGEASSIWTAGDPVSFPASQIEFIEGKGKISNFVKKNHVHTFTVESTEGVKLVDNTTYFPGWKVTIDGNKAPIEFQDQNYRGLITFQIPKGKHDVQVVFTESTDRIIANSISILAMLLVLGVFIYERSTKK